MPVRTTFIKLDVLWMTDINNLKHVLCLVACTTRIIGRKWVMELMNFERKITRKIFGPTRIDDGYWRTKTNQEINDILKGQNIIGFIKKQRLIWLGHFEHVAEDNIVQKVKR